MPPYHLHKKIKKKKNGYLKIKITHKFKWTFLPAELELATKALQFYVCCKAIDQNFDCGCGSLHSQKGLHKFVRISESKGGKKSNQKS